MNIIAPPGNAANADALLTRSISSALAAFSELDVLKLASSKYPNTTVNYWLLTPDIRLQGIEHSSQGAACCHCFQSKAQLYLPGDLVLTLCMGAPEPEAIIYQLDYKMAWDARD